MRLPPERLGPYLRALRAGLISLAPNADFPPLEPLLALLEALDPACSGDLLAPAELDERSGLPSLPWLERARAEAGATTTAEEPDDRRIARAMALDPALGARMEARRRLHALFQRQPPLPVAHLDVVLERLDTEARFVVSYDHMPANGGWARVRAELAGTRAWAAAGAIAASDPRGALQIHPGLRHLLARHAATPLTALHAQLTEVLAASVLRLSRGSLGPFWFPGLPLPPEVPPELGGGLVLHQSSEVVGVDIRASRHLDPWCAPPEGELVPRGSQVVRERRLCASPGLLPSLERWGQARGVPVVVLPLVPRVEAARRSL
ncbi:MAG: hypothetical protein ABIO70_15210 [Pseudomonadota bacterium]